MPKVRNGTRDLLVRAEFRRWEAWSPDCLVAVRRQKISGAEPQNICFPGQMGIGCGKGQKIF